MVCGFYIQNVTKRSTVKNPLGVSQFKCIILQITGHQHLLELVSDISISIRLGNIIVTVKVG